MLGNCERAVRRVAREVLESRQTLSSGYAASGSGKAYLLNLYHQLYNFQLFSVCSASGLLGGNEAKKANCFQVSVFGSNVGPTSAKTDSFLCPEPSSFFTSVVAGTNLGCG